MNTNGIVIGLVCGCLLAACTKAQDGKQEPGTGPEASELSVESVPSATSEADDTNRSVGDEVVLGPGLQRLADMAIQNLAVNLAIEADEISIVDAAFVTWRDSSLGCPQPDYEYMQVLTNGSRIRLSANKKIYQYHSGPNLPPNLCETPSEIEPLPFEAGEL